MLSGDSSHEEGSSSDAETRSDTQVDVNDKEKDRRAFSSSSSAASSSNLSSDDDENDSNDMQACGNNTKGSAKLSRNPLRDRIRNLRHRRSLNIESQSDFKQVLDSLNVVVNDDDPSCRQAENSDNTATSNALVSNNFLNPLVEIEIGDKALDDTESASNRTEMFDVENLLPKTSGYFSEKSSIVKTLNEHKRRIEFDEDDEFCALEQSEETKTKAPGDFSPENNVPMFKRNKKSEQVLSTCDSSTGQTRSESKGGEKRNYRCKESSPNLNKSFSETLANINE